MKTYTAKPKDIKKAWYVIDASNKVLGRLATRVATILRGKHKPMFTPHMDTGDNLIIINAEKIRLTGKKMEDKSYFRQLKHAGASKHISVKTVMEKDPAKVIRMAVQRMLPKNILGRKTFKKLHVYAGDKHPHAAQKPEPLAI
jgi:large subunit ribosomal protein L13